MATTSNYRGLEVDLEYGPELAETVAAIEAAGAINEDGVIQAWDAVKIFPGQPTLHTTMTEYTALIAAGCAEVK